MLAGEVHPDVGPGHRNCVLEEKNGQFKKSKSFFVLSAKPKSAKMYHNLSKCAKSFPKIPKRETKIPKNAQQSQKCQKVSKALISRETFLRILLPCG